VILLFVHGEDFNGEGTFPSLGMIPVFRFPVFERKGVGAVVRILGEIEISRAYSLLSCWRGDDLDDGLQDYS
jgi:hypothetical protein